jgi:hypothetical protein
VRRALAALLALGALASASPAVAASLECPQATMRERIDGADAVFVGTLLSSRGAHAAGARIYRFSVEQPVKGPLGTQVDVRAPRLVDAAGAPVAPGTDVGVLALLDGAEFTTDSCGITNPGALLDAADEPRGTMIKVGVGVVILAAVLAFALLRLRRRNVRERRTAV